jgi:ABC-type multidrug transport system fused ATPase/permease subunit
MIYGKKMKAIEKQTSSKNEGFVDQMKDLLNGFIVIKSFKAEKEVMHLFDNQNSELEEVKRNRRETHDKVAIISNHIPGACQHCAYLREHLLCIQRAYVHRFRARVHPVAKLYSRSDNAACAAVVNRKAALALIEKLASAVERKGEAAEPKDAIETLDSAIALEDVSFAYEENKETLKNVNIHFEKGKSYAIVGGSGSGKSTLLRLLLGHFRNYEGRVLFDKRELRGVNIESLYDIISVVQQNVFLFDSSLKNNITMFKEFSRKKYRQAVELAGLTSLVSEKGDEYRCGEGGSNLSGGEKQRVSIARCLIRESPVLLMDEATAALDNATAFSVTNSILKLNGLTKIIVTHKLDETLMQRFDNIIAMNGGMVAEAGSFEELMEKKGYFYSLYNVSRES